MKYINKIKRNQKSVQSVRPCKSVIQTNYDIVIAYGGDPDRARRQAGSYRDKKLIRKLTKEILIISGKVKEHGLLFNYR